jgi:hypothetical protein
MSGLKISELPEGTPSLSGIIPFTNDTKTETLRTDISNIINLTSVDKLSDVHISQLSDGDILIYNASASRWENRSLAELIAPTTIAPTTIAPTTIAPNMMCPPNYIIVDNESDPAYNPPDGASLYICCDDTTINDGEDSGCQCPDGFVVSGFDSLGRPFCCPEGFILDPQFGCVPEPSVASNGSTISLDFNNTL